MHLLDGFSCIQPLCHLRIISPRHLPVESFLDHAGSFCVFVCSFFALHAAHSSSLFAFPSAYHFPLLPTTPYIRMSALFDLELPLAMKNEIMTKISLNHN